MNEKAVQSLNLCLCVLLITRYQALLNEPSMGEQRERSKNKNSVRCQHECLPISSWRFCTKSTTHTIAVAVIVMAGAIVVRSSPCIPTTIAAFATSLSVGAAPVPFPRLAGVPADGALRPRCLSMGSPGPVMCRPWLGAVPQPS
jgi:hypothetical protein